MDSIITTLCNCLNPTTVDFNFDCQNNVSVYSDNVNDCSDFHINQSHCTKTLKDNDCTVSVDSGVSSHSAAEGLGPHESDIHSRPLSPVNINQRDDILFQTPSQSHRQSKSDIPYRDDYSVDCGDGSILAHGIMEDLN